MAPSVIELAKQQHHFEKGLAHQQPSLLTASQTPSSIDDLHKKKKLAFNLIGNQIVLKNESHLVAERKPNVELNVQHFTKFPGEINLRHDQLKANQQKIQQLLRDEMQQYKSQLDRDYQNYLAWKS